jgi:hypothetical protein
LGARVSGVVGGGNVGGQALGERARLEDGVRVVSPLVADSNSVAK